VRNGSSQLSLFRPGKPAADSKTDSSAAPDQDPAVEPDEEPDIDADIDGDDGDEDEPADAAANEVADPPAAAPWPSPTEVREKAQVLAARLAKKLGMDVRLAVTDNRSTVISYRRREKVLTLRVHHMFLSAPDDVVEALTQYAGKGQSSSSRVLDAFIKQHKDRLKPPRPPATIRARGLFYDLQPLFDRLNKAWFDDAIEARIGWGRLSAKRRRRSIRMGVYLHDEKLIRIHPALDRPEVPEFFVAFVVFHEMLHQAIPGERSAQRHQHHGPEFRARERAYPDYERAIAWEKAHLDLLLGRVTTP
jgi:hypothetical protein